MSVKFILIGMFAGIMMDAAFVLNFKKKIPNIIVQLIFWIIMTYIICKAMLMISDGYIPIYTFLFFIIGFSIYYYFLKKSYIETLNKIKKVYNKNYRKAIDIIFPRQVMRFIGRLFKKVLKKSLLLLKSIFKRKRKNADEIDKKEDETILNNANNIIN